MLIPCFSSTFPSSVAPFFKTCAVFGLNFAMDFNAFDPSFVNPFEAAGASLVASFPVRVVAPLVAVFAAPFVAILAVPFPAAFAAPLPINFAPALAIAPNRLSSAFSLDCTSFWLGCFPLAMSFVALSTSTLLFFAHSSNFLRSSSMIGNTLL